MLRPTGGVCEAVCTTVQQEDNMLRPTGDVCEAVCTTVQQEDNMLRPTGGVCEAVVHNSTAGRQHVKAHR